MVPDSIHTNRVAALAAISSIANQYDGVVDPEEILNRIFPKVLEVKPPVGVETLVRAQLFPDGRKERFLLRFRFPENVSTLWAFSSSCDSLYSAEAQRFDLLLDGREGYNLITPHPSTQDEQSNSMPRTAGALLICLALHGHDDVYPWVFGLQNPLIPQIGKCVGRYREDRVCVKIAGSYYSQNDFALFEQVPAESWRSA